MFGQHKYQYRLVLTEEFPSVIFKERNINVGVKLQDHNMETVLNCK